MKALCDSLKFPLLCLLSVAIVMSCARVGLREKDGGVYRSGTIYAKDLIEVSGIAVSRIHEDTLWVINDSGNSPSVYAIDSKGDLIATVDIQGVFNNDWEDVASFEYDGEAFILIADVGDNYARRSRCFLHFIKEPDIGKGQGSAPLFVKPSWSITYTYEDGPRDCEAVAVDVANKKILLLSKRDYPPVLYELPLTKENNAVAKRCTAIRPLPERAPLRDSNFVTAMDISADGASAVVLTYVGAFYFSKKESETWATVFLNKPKEILFPPMRQAEAICFSRDGSNVYITSEQLPAPLVRVKAR